MQDDPNSDLLERFVRGDREAFESLYNAFKDEVYRWIVRIVRDPGAAEDVLIEAFWRAYRGRARFDPSRSFGAWLRRIATNAALDHLRHAKPGAGWRELGDEIASADPPDRSVAEAVAIALRRLTPKLQVVATLAIIEELPHEEIADALELPVGTVKSRLHRATNALRIELARLGIHP